MDRSQRRQFLCDVCFKSYTRSFTLKNHKRTHTGEKPHKCSFTGCTSAFVSRDHCKTHEAIHAQNKQFECSVCAALFLRSCSLRRHETRKHGRPVASSYRQSATELQVETQAPYIESTKQIPGSEFTFEVARKDYPAFAPHTENPGGQILPEDQGQQKPSHFVISPVSPGQDHTDPPHPDSDLTVARFASWARLIEGPPSSRGWYERAWFEAAENGGAERLHYLFKEHKIDVDMRRNTVGIYPGTALDIASYYGHLAAVKMLIRLGARLHPLAAENQARYFSLPTPLHWATYHRHGFKHRLCDGFRNQKICTLVLIEKEGDVDVDAKGGRDDSSPLMEIAKCPSSLDILEIVLARTKDVDATDLRGRSIVHILASEHERPYGLDIASRHGANIAARDREGRTILHYANRAARQQIVEWILLNEPTGHGFKDYVDFSGRTALHSLCQGTWYTASSAKACIQLQLRHGADVNAIDNEGNTALMRWIITGAIWIDSDILEIMLKHNAALNVVNKCGETAADLASSARWVNAGSISTLRRYGGLRAREL